MKPLPMNILEKWIEDEKDFLLVDVRSREAYEDLHLPNAVAVPLAESDLVARVEELVGGAKNRTVVVYDDGEEDKDSVRAIGLLEDAGFLDVYHFVGGLSLWREARAS